MIRQLLLGIWRRLCEADKWNINLRNEEGTRPSGSRFLRRADHLLIRVAHINHR